MASFDNITQVDFAAPARCDGHAFLSSCRCAMMIWRNVAFVSVILFLALVAGVVSAQEIPGRSALTIVSQETGSITVRLAPSYTTTVVHQRDGSERTVMSFAGGDINGTIGAPGLCSMSASILLPSLASARIEIISQSIDVIPNVDLAPVPSYQKNGDGFDASYEASDSLYDAQPKWSPYDLLTPTVYRSAFTQSIRFTPIQYDVRTHSVSRVREGVYRIYYPAGLPPTVRAISDEERGFMRPLFLNGSRVDLYHAAAQRISAHVRPLNALKEAASGGTWLQVETTDEGMYRITAKDLADAGVADIDPDAIELLGVGGWILDETPTDSSGEWIEHPFELHRNGAALTDIVFYAPGVTRWKYSGLQSRTDGLYHRLNPYATSGHFLLHIGGALVGTPRFVGVSADSLVTSAAPTARVFTAVTFEQEQNFEVSNHSREFVGSTIPHSDVGALQFSVAAPGYTGDSTTIRVGCDFAMQTLSSIDVRVGGTLVGSIKQSGTSGNLVRSWDNAFSVPSSVGSPIPVSLTFNTSDVTAQAMLDWVAIMYRRSTDIGSSTIPFFVLDTKNAYQYNFTNASGGEVWDVTSLVSPMVLSRANSNTMAVDIQGASGVMRRFMAFSDASLLTPHLSRIAAPTLRSTIGQSGAVSIIITPAAFLDQARALQKLREQGGEATGPMSVAVVTIEDIFQQFGYGARDLTAVRDFLAYTMRHTIANGTTQPMYVTLLGSGHADYLNRVTQATNWIPIWEAPQDEYLATYRSTAFDPWPDDAYFVRLTPGAPDRALDLAIGRVPARSSDEAAAYVAKVQEYEHSSAQGDWRSRVTLVADDRIASDPNSFDGIDHFADSQDEAGRIPNRLFIQKIYGCSYPNVYTAQGREKPEMATAVLNAINDGAVLYSFIGHGNPHVWTHESILVVPTTVNKFVNFDKLTYMTTVTCNFSQDDDFNDLSGGVQILMRPNGGAIGLLGTTREVTGHESLVFTFYSALFGENPGAGYGTSSVGAAYIAGKFSCYNLNLPYYYLLGDPSQRLLIPSLYVTLDSINQESGDNFQLPALSAVRVVGHVVRDTGALATPVTDFNGTATVTLYDANNTISSTTTLQAGSITDTYQTQGPILYRGTVTITNGRFDASFIIPKDIKYDTAAAELSVLAYSDDARSALGATQSIHLTPADSSLAVVDTTGPQLTPYIGSRIFHSGDDVSMNSQLMVDVYDAHGLNTSTASIGHSFIGWVDDDMADAFDLSEGYVSSQDDFRSGTSTIPVSLPAGHHTLHIRAFDSFDNPGFASVDFVAKKAAPFQLYEVTNQPNPVVNRTVFRLTQPGANGSQANVDLSIYSSDGRLVRELHALASSSVVEIPWDGTDASGWHVANGAYTYQIVVKDLTDGSQAQAGGICIVSR